MKEFRKVVVAVDGSPGSIQAARAGARLADAMEIPLALVHVFPLMTHEVTGAMGLTREEIAKIRESAAEKVFAEIMAELSERTSEPEHVALIGDPAEEILAYLDNQQDLLCVVGRRGQSKLGALLLGSVSDKVVRHTHTPVTIVS